MHTCTFQSLKDCGGILKNLSAIYTKISGISGRIKVLNKCTNRSKTVRPSGATLYRNVEIFPFRQPHSYPCAPTGAKICKAEQTHCPLGHAKFYLNRCNESPMKDENSDFWPVMDWPCFEARRSFAWNYWEAEWKVNQQEEEEEFKCCTILANDDGFVALKRRTEIGGLV